MMIGLALSLLLVVAIANLPIKDRQGRVGWHVVPPSKELTLEQLGLESLARAALPTPLSALENTAAAPDDGLDEQSSVADEKSAGTVERTYERVELTKISGHKAILEFAEKMPEIVGGVGAYYINIEYPKKAAEEGIQGRLILDFVVETNGRPSNITIAQSLHPLCDSAAVRALRETRFVPGRQNGEPVRVRMRLPVRFQLIMPEEEPEQLTGS